MNIPPLDKKRLQIYKFNRKLKRVKISLFILLALLLIYFAQKVILNAFVFHPVRAIASSDQYTLTVVKIVPVDHIFKTQRQQILAYIVEKFGDRAGDAISIINQCENHAFNPDAINHNPNGSIDVGVMQINTSPTSPEAQKLHDWKYNIDRGFAKYKSRGNKFTDWTCASVIGEKNYLSK